MIPGLRAACARLDTTARLTTEDKPFCETTAERRFLRAFLGLRTVGD